MNEGAKNSWFSKLKNNLKERHQEVGAVTYATNVKDAVVDVGRQVGNRAEEIGVGIRGEVTTVGHQLDTLGTQINTGVNRVQDNLQDMRQNLGEVAQSVGSDLLDTHVFTEQSGTRTGVREKAQLLIARNANKLGTIIDDRLIPWLKRLDNTAGDPGEIKAELQAENQASQPTPEVDDKTAEVIEGQSLIDVVAGNLKTAVAFDQMKDKELGAIIEKMMDGSEIVTKVGKVIFRQIIAVVLEQSSIGGRTPSALEAMAELRKDESVMAQLRSLNGEDLMNTIDNALRTVSELRKKAKEARGENKNLSWKYEAGLIENSEKAQREMAALGLEIRQILPENGERITATVLASARGKGFEYARKADEAMRNLKHVALSLEIRFPSQVDAIRAKLQEIVNDWKEAKAVIPTISGEMFTKELSADCKRVVDWEFIAQDPSLRSVNEPPMTGGTEMQRTALAEVGITLIDRGLNGESPYEMMPGSMYADAVETFTQYTGLVKAYEVAREQVAEHPEAADRLFVLAERVAQMRHAFEDIRIKITGELAIQVDRARNIAEIKQLQSEHRPEEAAARQERADYRLKVLVRFKERWNRELPVIKKALTYATALGVSATVLIGAQQYIEQINLATAQADILRNATNVEVAQMIQHVMAEVMDKLAALNAAVEPIMEAGKAAGWSQVKEIALKAAPWLATLGVGRVVTGWVQKLGDKFAKWRLGEKPRDVKAEVKVVSREPYVAGLEAPVEDEASKNEEQIAELKANLKQLKGMSGMEATIHILEERIIGLGGTLDTEEVSADNNTNTPAAA